MSRVNERLAIANILKETRENLANKEAKAISEAEARRNQFLKERNNILESAETKRRRHGALMEICRNNALATAIKGIFIGALEAGTLTDNGIILAETMVENYIKEKGGAKAILTENKNKTYLLHRIAEIVEEAAILEAEDIEDIDKEDDSKEEKKEDKTPKAPTDDQVEKAMDTIKDKLKDDKEAQDALKVIQNRVDPDDAKDTTDDNSKEDDKEDTDSDTSSEDSSDDNEEILDADDLDVDKDLGNDSGSEELTPIEDEGGDKEESSDGEEDNSSEDEAPEEDSGEEDIDADLDSDDDSGEDEELTDDSNDDEGSEDGGDEDLGDDPTDGEETESEVADDITDDIEDVPDKDLSVDGEEESKGKVLDDLEKEEDVQKAVELIRQRVADAEENFIKRNAEDKKQVEELIGRISDNVKTVEDIADEEDPESQAAQESARMNKRRMNAITSKRPLTVLEKMTRILHANVVKDTVLREAYINENNKIDVGLVVESAKVMYAFLETLNTLQLEKVDAEYIRKTLEEMK